MFQRYVYFYHTFRLAWQLKSSKQLLRMLFAQLSLAVGILGTMMSLAHSDGLQNYYNRRGNTGLYCSYQVDNDRDYLYNFGSTYDQALIAMNAVREGNMSIALEILDFFKERYEASGSICASYDVDTGLPKESMMRSGEVFWLGLALCHYQAATGDKRYEKFIRRLANQMLSLQQKDGRFLGGPGMTWASTEHNIDGYAFYSMAYELTDEERYLQARGKVEKWLMNRAYNKYQRRFNRGDSDIQFATDTHSFGVLALHDAMTSEHIRDLMTYVERHSKVGYGFDFTNRKAAISFEWTLQLALVYKLIGEYDKWEHITQSVKKLLDKQGGIPYASKAVDTTHGWIASTNPAMSSLMWYQFAEAGFNPFVLPGTVDPIIFSDMAKLPSDRTQDLR